MKHVLVYEDDPEAFRLIRDLIRDPLMGVSIGAERVQSDVAAYRRIPSLPTLDALIMDLARPDALQVARFARQVIPSIRLVYLGARGDDATTGRLSFPPGEFVPSALVTADLACALAGAFAEPV